MPFPPLAHEMSPDHYQRHGTASYDVHDIERRKKKLAHGSIVSRLLPFRNEPSVPHTRIPGQRNSGRFLLAEETFPDGHPIEELFYQSTEDQRIMVATLRPRISNRCPRAF